MKVLLIDADMYSKRRTMPNLALMKLSSHHKKERDKTYLNKCEGYPDKVYISTVFTWNKGYALQVKKFYEIQGIDVEVGGSGYDYRITLPDEIEHIMPDYDLYGVDYSMGFTSRGCIRRCPFCIVPKKEGFIKEWAELGEFLHPKHKKVILLDNNFLASPTYDKVLDQLMERKLKVNFNQGLDIRLITHNNAKKLRKVKFYNHTFKSRKLHFAWDWVELEDAVMKGIRILFDVGFKPYELMFYVLVGFNTTIEEDLYRVRRLIEMKIDPFVMIYRDFEGKTKPSQELKDLARWVNKRIYKVVSWEKYDRHYGRRDK